MPSTLDKTAALVTGASSGIGEATARALASEGAAVAIAARRRERLDELVEKITADGGSALAIEADVTDQAQAREAVRKTVERFGRLDTLINNAGIMLLGPIVDAPTEEWDRMVDINEKGLLYCTHAALPHLLEAAQDSPRQVADVVNVSSVAGRVAREGSGVYNLTKWGISAFSESLRQEVTERHVRVALVEPGAVNTELTDHIRDEIRDQTKKTFEGIEKLESEDIAGAIVYIVTRPRRVAINELLVRPTGQKR